MRRKHCGGMSRLQHHKPSRVAAATALLGEFLDGYINRRTDVKPRTRINLFAAKARLVEFFGAGKALPDITPADADNWLLWLRERYANGTAGRTVKRAKQFFRAVVGAKLIPNNPFADMKPLSQTNPSRLFFVTAEMARQVLDACPDVEWRLLFALSRYGRLRCPSEHLALTWPDIDWERDRMRVHSPKKEHLEAGGDRWVPLFPELRAVLAEAFDLAPEGAVHVITRYRDTNSNLRTQLMRMIRRAGLTPWPKLFQNLRASRETELAAQYPLHVVCAWIGNTEMIAAKHYLQVTEDHFRRAAKSGAASRRRGQYRLARNDTTPPG
jgi:integrase